MAYVTGTLAADGNGDEIIINSKGLLYVGLVGGNTFGSGTVTLQYKAPTGAWCNSGVTTTTSKVISIDTNGIPTPVRIVLSGATTPDLDYVIESDLRYVAVS